MSWDVFVTSTHLAPNELVIHLFVAILLLEPFEGRGVVAEHTLKVDEVHFSHADAPLLGLQTFREGSADVQTHEHQDSIDRCSSAEVTRGV